MSTAILEFCFLLLVAATAQKYNYDEVDALRLFHLAASAYGDKQAECVYRAYGDRNDRIVHATHSTECDVLGHHCGAFIVHSRRESEAVIVFRGTKTLTQLFTEGWQSIEPSVDFLGMGEVNRYFATAQLSMWPEIERYLTGEGQEFNIVLTGHSLGGAIAALSAARIVKQGFRKPHQVRVVTFGQPRVGSAKFAFSYDQLVPNSFRVVNGMDIVPHLPACAKNWDLMHNSVYPCDPNQSKEPYHHGTEVWYPSGMGPSATYKVCWGPPMNEDFVCSDRIKFHIDDITDAVGQHRRYFDVKVADHGKAGCNARNNTSFLQRTLSTFNSFVKRLGFE